MTSFAHWQALLASEGLRVAAEAKLDSFLAMQPRSDNLPWQEELHAERQRDEAYETSVEHERALLGEAALLVDGELPEPLVGKEPLVPAGHTQGSTECSEKSARIQWRVRVHCVSPVLPYVDGPRLVSAHGCSCAL